MRLAEGGGYLRLAWSCFNLNWATVLNTHEMASERRSMSSSVPRVGFTSKLNFGLDHAYKFGYSKLDME
jgi:hypothetical protein